MDSPAARCRKLKPHSEAILIIEKAPTAPSMGALEMICSWADLGKQVLQEEGGHFWRLAIAFRGTLKGGKVMTRPSLSERRLSQADPTQPEPRAGEVLVVDDDYDIREVVSATLEDAGFSVDSAANGQEAIDKLEQAVNSPARPCLILLDMMMPVMNGWQFLEKRAQSPQLMKIPVLVVSASAVAPEQVDGFLRKPLEIDSLLDKVGEYCLGA